MGRILRGPIGRRDRPNVLIIGPDDSSADMAAAMPPITRLLVANRGEIARRVFRTAREMGIGTVAVFAESDRDAPFVREADFAIPLGGTTSAETYLDADRLIAAARLSGADAIHPGYGFLSEDEGFARAVIEAGLIWVGPTPAVIAAMGDKLAAKALLAKANVPMLPGFDLSGAPESAALAFADSVGYPVLVKASGGGGGRGMRVVSEAADLQSSIAAARREAEAAFGNDTLFIEKYVQPARHIEVQILGDSHGNLVHCFERECSIQRRHQKVIEEAPSSAVAASLRERMCEAALAAGRVLGYASAGTVEFLLAPDGQFYFLEVNTRIQVEHPVTEMITGLDLVREQLRVAMGEPLSVRQEQIAIHGHAIEARLYAEDPEKNFLPSPGTILLWEYPAGPGIRVESAIESGSEISPHFDPMLAKIIAHAPSRQEAAVRLASALLRTRVHGVTTNRDFLVSALRHTAFLAGDTYTDFIETQRPSLARIPGEEELFAALIAATFAGRSPGPSPFHRGRPLLWLDSSMWEQVSWRRAETDFTVRFRECRDGRFDVQVGDRESKVRVRVMSDAVTVEGEIGRRQFTVHSANGRAFVQSAAGEIAFVEVPRFPETVSALDASGYAAPMPGRVVEVAVRAGDKVRRGQHLLTLEAMKMEHRIVAASDGIIRDVLVSVGDQVAANQVLIIFATAEGA
jgi:acetyl-CoA carboxylase biotin carboxylase subunit